MNSRLFFDPGIPGSDLVEEGLSDIQNGRVTSSALLVLAASPRLQRLGLAIPNLAGATSPAEIPYEHQLYDLLGDYSLYNSLLRRISSYASTLESRRHANENSQPMPQPFSVDKFPR